MDTHTGKGLGEVRMVLSIPVRRSVIVKTTKLPVESQALQLNDHLQCVDRHICK